MANGGTSHRGIEFQWYKGEDRKESVCMSCAVVVTIEEGEEQGILHTSQIRQITSSQAVGVRVIGPPGQLCIEIEDESFPIINSKEQPNSPFYLVLTSGEAIGIRNFKFLFGLKLLSDGCLSGKDVNGKPYRARPLTLESLTKGVEPSSCQCEGPVELHSMKELESVKELLARLKQGEFYAALTEELSEKIKKIADEMKAFREDLQKKIEPNIVGLVTNEIPETSNELEGINETLEKSTMKIMDINDEILALCASRLQEFNFLVSEACSSQDRKDPQGQEEIKDKLGLLTEQLSDNLTLATDLIKKQVNSFEKIRRLSMNMTEPLCFQDLVGQRIQKIVRLVKSMEERVQDLVLTLGVKLQKHKENPNMSFEQVNKELGKDNSLLRGPQKEGEGLNQSAVDELLASL